MASSDTAVVSAELVARFEREGFVLVAGLLDEHELDHFGPLVDRAVAVREEGDTRALAERSRYEQSFRQCQNLWEDFPELRPLTFHPRIARAAAELFGAEAVRVWHDQALYKEAGGRETDAHQDQPYWPVAEPRTVTAWIPLDGADRSNGCMAYVPGSHAVGLRRFIDIFGVRDAAPEDLLADPALSDVDPVFVEAPRGSVVFHHGLTAHFAGANTTPRPRRVHTVIYLADGCRRGRRFAHFAVDRPRVEVGAVIDSDLTPIAWPRPMGDLPPAPSC